MRGKKNNSNRKKPNKIDQLYSENQRLSTENQNMRIFLSQLKLLQQSSNNQVSEVEKLENELRIIRQDNETLSKMFNHATEQLVAAQGEKEQLQSQLQQKTVRILELELQLQRKDTKIMELESQCVEQQQYISDATKVSDMMYDHFFVLESPQEYDSPSNSKVDPINIYLEPSLHTNTEPQSSPSFAGAFGVFSTSPATSPILPPETSPANVINNQSDSEPENTNKRLKRDKQ